MTIRNLVISIVGFVAVSLSSLSAITLKIDTDQPLPLESNAPCVFRFTWTGDPDETWIPEPLLLTFKHTETEKVWYDRLFPSIDRLPDMTRNWKLIHTAPVFIPAQSHDAEWIISVSTSKQDFPDLLTIKTARRSVFQKPFTLTYREGLKDLNEIIPLEISGFHDRETTYSSPDRWIWMSGDCRIILPNFGIPVIFSFIGWIPATVAQGLQVEINGHVLETGDIVQDHYRFQKAIPTAWLENSEHIDIRMQTKEAFTPADDGLSQDKRLLGMMIKKFHICAETDTPDNRSVFDLLYDLEPQEPWLWTSSESCLTFSNPARDFRIFLQGWIPEHLFHPQSILLIQFNDTIIDTQALNSPYFRLLYHIPLQSIGPDPEVSLGMCRVFPLVTANMGIIFCPESTIFTKVWAY